MRGRKENLSVARFTLGCLAMLRMRTLVFDTSCLYGTNVRELTSGLPEEFLRDASITTINRDSELKRSLAALHTRETRAIIIDDLNALNDLLVGDERNSSGIHKLFRLIGVLSYEARTKDLCILSSVYKSTISPPEKNPRRSIAAAADLRISTESSPQSLVFRCKGIEGWPNDRFETNLYLALNT